MNTDRLRIELTKEQQEQIKAASGQELQTVELSIEELEQRVAPEVFLKWNLTNTYVSSY